MRILVEHPAAAVVHANIVDAIDTEREPGLAELGTGNAVHAVFGYLYAEPVSDREGILFVSGGFGYGLCRKHAAVDHVERQGHRETSNRTSAECD